MSWVKIDDQFHGHPKAVRAWRTPRALGLHVLALSYCGAYLTDGHVPAEFVEEKLPQAPERTRTVDALVDAGLWVVEDGGWRINDFLDYNDSRAEIEARRRKDSERKRTGARKESKKNPSGVRTDSAAPAGGRGRAAADAPRPGPGSHQEEPPPSTERFDARAPVAGLHSRLGEVVQILEACSDPDGRGLLVEPASINSMILAHPDRDPVRAAHKTAAIVQAGNNRSSNATSLFGSVIAGMKPEPADTVPARDERRARRHAAMQRLMDSSTEEGAA